MSLDWEGLRTFAHVCQTGNMTAAARELGVNQTTIARRIARLEEWLGYPVLHRDGRLLRATPRARSLLETAQTMQTTVSTLLENQPASKNDRHAVTGIVRVTGVDAILEHCVALHQKHPALALELIGANRNLSLSQRETDIAIRLARPETGAFHIRRLGMLGSGVYYSGNHPPVNPYDVPWIDLDDFFADKPEQKWLAANFPDRTTIGYANRGSIMVAMMRGQPCCAVLPVCVGQAHQDKRHLPQVRVVADWLADVLVDGRGIIRL